MKILDVQQLVSGPAPVFSRSIHCYMQRLSWGSRLNNAASFELQVVYLHDQCIASLSSYFVQYLPIFYDVITPFTLLPENPIGAVIDEDAE